jgi:hypothetical protein
VALVMIGATGAGAIVTVNVAVLVPAAFAAVMVTSDVPGAEGVPVIAPVPESKVRPAGRPLAVKLVGWPLAAIT